MGTNKVFAISNKPGEVMLKSFTYMKDRIPDNFEVCLIVEKNGYLSAGCWDTGVWSTDYGKVPGSFRQSRGDVIFYMDVQTGNILETDKNGKDEIYYFQSTLRAWYLDMREKLLEDYQNGRFTILLEWDEQGKKKKRGLN